MAWNRKVYEAFVPQSVNSTILDKDIANMLSLMMPTSKEFPLKINNEKEFITVTINEINYEILNIRQIQTKRKKISEDSDVETDRSHGDVMPQTVER